VSGFHRREAPYFVFDATKFFLFEDMLDINEVLFILDDKKHTKLLRMFRFDWLYIINTQVNSFNSPLPKTSVVLLLGYKRNTFCFCNEG